MKITEAMVEAAARAIDPDSFELLDEIDEDNRGNRLNREIVRACGQSRDDARTALTAALGDARAQEAVPVAWPTVDQITEVINSECFTVDGGCDAYVDGANVAAERIAALYASPVPPAAGLALDRGKLAMLSIDDEGHRDSCLKSVLIAGFTALKWALPVQASEETIDAIRALARPAAAGDVAAERHAREVDAHFAEMTGLLVDALKDSKSLREALDAIIQRANRSSAGEVELLTKIHDIHCIARAATTKGGTVTRQERSTTTKVGE